MTFDRLFSATHEWKGAVWRFASAGNRDLFAASPETHAPRYGGYYAKAVREGKVAPISPFAWKIVDGRLYLNYDLNMQRTWEENYRERIERADRNWPLLLEK